jgi:hypothetical protein
MSELVKGRIKQTNHQLSQNHARKTRKRPTRAGGARLETTGREDQVERGRRGLEEPSLFHRSRGPGRETKATRAGEARPDHRSGGPGNPRGREPQGEGKRRATWHLHLFSHIKFTPLDFSPNANTSPRNHRVGPRAHQR